MGMVPRVTLNRMTRKVNSVFEICAQPGMHSSLQHRYIEREQSSNIWYLNAKEVGRIGNKGLLVAKVESPDTSRHDLPHHTPAHTLSAQTTTMTHTRSVTSPGSESPG